MKAFFGTALGKAVIGLLAAAVVIGGGYGVYRAVQAEPAVAVPDETTTAVVSTEVITTTEEPTTEETTTEAATEAPTAAPTAPPTQVPTQPASAHPDIILKYADGSTSPYKLVWVDKEWGGDPNKGPGNIAKGYYEYKGAEVTGKKFLWPESDGSFWDQWMFRDPRGQGGEKFWTVTHNYDPGFMVYLYGGDRFILQSGYRQP